LLPPLVQLPQVLPVAFVTSWTTSPKGRLEVKDAGNDGLLFFSGATNVANSPVTLFDMTIPGTAYGVYVRLQVHGIASGVAWLSFSQDFVVANNGVLNTGVGAAVETGGGGTMTLSISGTTLSVKFNHASGTTSSMSWSAVIQGEVGAITKY